MAMTQAPSPPEQRLRCGELIERTVLAGLGVQAAITSSNGMFLSLHATREEIRKLVSNSSPTRIRLTLIPSTAKVMYAVLSVQAGSLQWRHVVPIWDAQARRWLEDCVLQQRISIACWAPDADDVTVMQWVGAWPQSDALLKLAEDWPELDDEAKAFDFSAMVDALAEPPAIQSSDPAHDIEEVQVVTHSTWLLNYLEATEQAVESTRLH